METRESPRRTRLLASGLLVLTFVVGGLAGAATDRMLNASNQPNATNVQRQDVEGRFRRRARSIFLDTLVFHQIGATPEQRQEIEALLARRDQDLSAVFEKMRPVLDTIMTNYRHYTRAVLSAEQQAKLELVIQERYAARQRDRAARDSSHNRSRSDSANKSRSDSAKRP
jgi:Spy/CpxP family protein refolding chaperone